MSTRSKCLYRPSCPSSIQIFAIKQADVNDDDEDIDNKDEACSTKVMPNLAALQHNFCLHILTFIFSSFTFFVVVFDGNGPAVFL